MHAHRSKRDLASASSGPANSISYSSLSDSTAHRYQHGHQHDHLHGPFRVRGLNNSDFAPSGTNVVATGEEHPKFIVAGTIGAASLSEHLMEQSASETNASPLADGQDISQKGATGELTVPQSLLEDQSAVPQGTPAFNTNSPSKTTANVDTHSILQQQYSMAERVSFFGDTSSILGVMVFGLWVFFFAIMYH